MSDVSITDLIAEAKALYDDREYSGDARPWRTLSKLIDALESVTVPTENEREVMTAAVYEAIERWADLLPTPKVAEFVADAILARFHLPFPVERDPREVAHIECDCVPAEGPSHCHLCGERAGHPISWADAHAAVPVEPVQVTNEMVEKAARSIFAAMRTSHPLSSMADYDDPAYEYTKNACKRDARAALEAALGGGDHE